ncbi:PREDICTED: small RNA degrading nuclease 1-like isoform X2 [Nelumbo nucifera]|uniref:Exonuclease domain-containing protein n=2 Tax=Nelumbo nucifera TaxID=4432 RepID=A0A822Z8H3_NELNU|nr:PREDICTED: small RNA degrading nuclease 1-like isoform X2 [Nelumbo nucifera]DAD41352.1 TPA_asm: hypothetical protein HUJ06_015675 [Nelumbo nucifera]
MDEKIACAEKEVLVEIVRLAQRRGMKGAAGGWKEFLDHYDKKLGSSLSDPARRSIDVLAAFLKTFTKEEDLKIFAKILQCHSNRKAIKSLSKNSPDLESPQQRLVRLTLEHPQYPIYYSFPSYNEEWVVTNLGKISKIANSNEMFAVDCEMVLCEDNTEAVVQVCVVDHNLKVKINELVNPNKAVADYRTDITGISAKDLDGVTCTLADVQRSLKKLLKHGAILIGHSLNSDLEALKLDHARVIDTSFIFKYINAPVTRRPSLNNLCKSVLGHEVRKQGAQHNCLDDAFAAMKLVLAKLEKGFNEGITMPHEDIPETELAKLLIHGIPVEVPSKELKRIFPTDYMVEFQPNLKVRGQKYSTFAIFKDAQEASQAFERIEGIREKDSRGRPQKFISFQLSTGATTSLYVRKMATDDLDPSVESKKRLLQEERIINETKKSKMMTAEESKPSTESNQCEHLIKEIERLKEELSKREEENRNLQTIMAALIRKSGL